MAKANSITNHPQIKDLTGQRFGRLVVLGFAGQRKSRSYWICRCACGTVVNVGAANLRRGNTSSCGCLQREWARVGQIVHGHSRNGHRSAEYHTWHGMKRRCNDPNSTNYRNYGGRGIRVCERWNSFENFLLDMGHKPTPKHSLDRIDNNGRYTPENCRWATETEQKRNTRRNRLISFRGETHCLIKWAELISMKYLTLYYRICRGWSIERALTEPVQKRKSRRTNESVPLIS